jgi:membrane fusion protein, multidrug efflux system
MNATTTATRTGESPNRDGTQALLQPNACGAAPVQVKGPTPDGRAEVVDNPAATLQFVGALGTARNISGSADRPHRRGLRRNLALTLSTTLLAMGLGFAGYRWWVASCTWVTTDNAYVAAHAHTVSPRVAGTVQEVVVDENQTVQEGNLLARLDPRDFEIRRAQALAQLAQAQAQRQQAEAKIAEARAQATREQARAGKARQDLQRAEALFSGGAGAISRQEYDQAKAEAEATAAALEAAQAAIGSAQAIASAADAARQVAQSNLDEAQQQLSYTTMLAPASGRIGKKNLEAGNRVQPGQAVLALVEPEVWITANFKETQLVHMKPGQQVEIRLDGFPGRRFRGRVESLSPASGAQFALLPPDNATGNFTRIVQRVPVKIVFDANGLGDCQGRIVPGMSAVVEVRVRES